MSVEVRIIDGPIGDAATEAWVGGAGAFLVFEGLVRGTEDGRPLAALEYDVYEPMASTELRRLGEDVSGKHGLIRLECLHSRGRVGVGERSMRVLVWAAHRREALAGIGEFIDRLKRDVPIWKRPVFADAGED